MDARHSLNLIPFPSYHSSTQRPPLTTHDYKSLQHHQPSNIYNNSRAPSINSNHLTSDTTETLDEWENQASRVAWQDALPPQCPPLHCPSAHDGESMSPLVVDDHADEGFDYCRHALVYTGSLCLHSCVRPASSPVRGQLFVSTTRDPVTNQPVGITAFPPHLCRHVLLGRPTMRVLLDYCEYFISCVP
jgi:hypothetical protein